MTGSLSVEELVLTIGETVRWTIQDDDFRWLTYAELAAMRGISRTSAERLVLRRRWRKQKGNDGAVRVSVPATFLTSPDASPDTSPDLSPDLRARIKDLEAELASIIEQLTARALSEAVALAQIAEKEVLVAVLREQLHRINEQLDQERNRSNESQAQVTALIRQLAELRRPHWTQEVIDRAQAFIRRVRGGGR